MLAERITDSLLREGCILEGEREIVQFGLESLGGNLLSFCMALAVGVCFGGIAEGVFLWLFLLPLRKNAGGFHAKTRERCLLLSMAMLVVAFVIYAVWAHSMQFYVASVALTGTVIWILAPVENPSKELDAMECRVYRRRSRGILMAEAGIFALAGYFQWEVVAESVVMAFFIVSISLIMGRLKFVKWSKDRKGEIV